MTTSGHEALANALTRPPESTATKDRPRTAIAAAGSSSRSTSAALHPPVLSDEGYVEAWRSRAPEDAADIVESWLAAGNPDLQLDLCDELRSASALTRETFPPLPHTARHIDISGNGLGFLPRLPQGVLSVDASDNDIPRIEPDALHWIVTRGPERSFNLSGNASLDRGQLADLDRVCNGDGYHGPAIAWTTHRPASHEAMAHLDDVVAGLQALAYEPISEVHAKEAFVRRAQAAGAVCFEVSAVMPAPGAGPASVTIEPPRVPQGTVDQRALLVAFHPQRLAGILSEAPSQALLADRQCPSDPRVFAEWVVNNPVSPTVDPELYSLIARAFANPMQGLPN